MPWCPKCKSEYVEGIGTCADCGFSLIEQLPANDQHQASEPAEPVVENFLINVGNNNEANLIQSILESHGIICIKKFKGAGEYLNIAGGFANFI